MQRSQPDRASLASFARLNEVRVQQGPLLCKENEGRLLFRLTFQSTKASKRIHRVSRSTSADML